jgi:glucose uptake protein GlcU
MSLSEDECKKLEYELKKLQDELKKLKDRTKWVIVSSVIGVILIIIGMVTVYSGKLLGILIIGIGSIGLVIAGVLLSCHKDKKEENSEKNLKVTEQPAQTGQP